MGRDGWESAYALHGELTASSSPPICIMEYCTVWRYMCDKHFGSGAQPYFSCFWYFFDSIVDFGISCAPLTDSSTPIS